MVLKLKNISGDCVFSFFVSPVGKLAIIVSDAGLHSIVWPELLKDRGMKELLAERKMTNSHPVCKQVISQLDEYFYANRSTFDIPLVLNGTQFQNAAWKSLQSIPYGKTVSYEEQAILIGGKEKVRAVGRANGMNPIPIIIPCHRVIGKDGSLTGFGGGLASKAFLLDLEAG